MSVQCSCGCTCMVLAVDDGWTDNCPDCGTPLVADEDGGWCEHCQRHISHARMAQDPWRDE
jgi:hypothetical protein